MSQFPHRFELRMEAFLVEEVRQVGAHAFEGCLIGGVEGEAGSAIPVEEEASLGGVRVVWGGKE
jgi:hypothetical protein